MNKSQLLSEGLLINYSVIIMKGGYSYIAWRYWNPLPLTGVDPRKFHYLSIHAFFCPAKIDKYDYLSSHIIRLYEINIDGP